MKLFLVLTENQFATGSNWINDQNGWPDGRGTERYTLSLPFNIYSNCPAQLENRVGLRLDKALIRNVADAVEGETKKDKIERIATIIRNNLSSPTVVGITDVTATFGELSGSFADVTSEAVERVRALVNN